MSRSIDDAGVQPAVRDAGLITILVTFAADSGFVFDVTAHGPHPLGSDIFEGCFDAVLAALG